MTRAGALRWVGSVVATAVLLAVTACTPQTGALSPTGQPSGTDLVGASDTSGVLAQRRAAGIADCPASDPSVAARPDGLPELTLDCLGGDSRVRLAGLRGTPMVLNVWAQWCGPCRAEGPYLAEVQQRAGDKVMLLGIDYADPRPDAAVEMAGQLGWTYPHVTDPHKDTALSLRVVGPPHTVFVDAEGRIVYRHAGQLTSTDQLVDLIRTHLGVNL
ncbi:TlpA family protein disulfide reductase [Granulicoccus phenolivorans]|uniref:TlpA family protein disulfide reductase n=1 Tax=Granulicoccus phenolivorans TaxID=266854 RepID=UPI00041A98AF|nr:TlpA disulfide reductase family protein [Granulicoccus phenolivorans]